MVEKGHEICHDRKEYLKSTTMEKYEILLIEKGLEIYHGGEKI